MPRFLVVSSRPPVTVRSSDGVIAVPSASRALDTGIKALQRGSIPSCSEPRNHRATRRSADAGAAGALRAEMGRE